MGSSCTENSVHGCRSLISAPDVLRSHDYRLLLLMWCCRRLGPMPLHVLPHPNPMPWGPFRPRQPMMPPNIIGGDYDRFPNVGGFGFGAGNLPGGLGFSGSGVGPGFMPGGGMGLGSGGGAMFSGGGGGALGQAGPVPAGFRGPRGGGGLGPGGMPGLGGGRRSGNSSSNTRLY